MTGVRGGLGDHVQQHPACRPASTGLKPGRRGQPMGGIEVGQLRHKLLGSVSDLRVVLQQASQRPVAPVTTGTAGLTGPAVASAAQAGGPIRTSRAAGAARTPCTA